MNAFFVFLIDWSLRKAHARQVETCSGLFWPNIPWINCTTSVWYIFVAACPFTLTIISPLWTPARSAAPPGLTVWTNTGLSPDKVSPYPSSSFVTRSVREEVEWLALGSNKRCLETLICLCIGSQKLFVSNWNKGSECFHGRRRSFYFKIIHLLRPKGAFGRSSIHQDSQFSPSLNIQNSWNFCFCSLPGFLGSGCKQIFSHEN